MKTNPAPLAILLALSLVACGAGGADDGAASPTTGPAASAVTSNGVTATLSLQSDWTAGYCANVVLANAGTAPVTSWTLVIELYQATVSQSPWGATATRSGSQMTVRPVDYTATIAPGASVSFGFCGAATGSNYRPALTSLAVVGGSLSQDLRPAAGETRANRVLSYEGPFGVGYMVAVLADENRMLLRDAAQ